MDGRSKKTGGIPEAYLLECIQKPVNTLGETIGGEFCVCFL